jgi:hypothetical protein
VHHGGGVSVPRDPDLLRELLWQAINRYSANRADLNARSQAAAKINEIVDVMLGTKR